LLLCLLAVLFKIFCIITHIAKVTRRLEMLTDIKGWMDIFKFFKKKK
jgi:hypothetical protein